jgi:hypothetical protein
MLSCLQRNAAAEAGCHRKAVCSRAGHYSSMLHRLCKQLVISVTTPVVIVCTLMCACKQTALYTHASVPTKSQYICTTYSNTSRIMMTYTVIDVTESRYRGAQLRCVPAC